MNKGTDKKDIPCNFSFLFYENPIYNSNTVYGIEENLSDDNKTDDKKEAPIDEPIESWGWVNNVDKDI